MLTHKDEIIKKLENEVKLLKQINALLEEKLANTIKS